MRIPIVPIFITGFILLFILTGFNSDSQARSKLAKANYLSFQTEDEANTMEIFDKARRSVVYVTNVGFRTDRLSLNIQRIRQGTGSGFIWDESGIVVSNWHVIKDAKKVKVTLYDGSIYEAKYVGGAIEKDIVVMRIQAPKEKLKALAIGDSSQLKVGRKVLAIGNPFGLDTSLSVGIVSALGRTMPSSEERLIHDVIQTDAAINPGNSGGPLLNSLGQLIGVNTAIYSPDGASVGIGFAIPVNIVKKIVPQLIKYGRIMRPIIGITIAPDSWSKQYDDDMGVLVLDVHPKSPAEKAGMLGTYRDRNGALILGDIIISIDGKEVRTNDDLLNILEGHKPGDNVIISAQRYSDLMRFKVTLTKPLR